MCEAPCTKVDTALVDPTKLDLVGVPERENPENLALFFVDVISDRLKGFDSNASGCSDGRIGRTVRTSRRVFKFQSGGPAWYVMATLKLSDFRMMDSSASLPGEEMFECHLSSRWTLCSVVLVSYPY